MTKKLVYNNSTIECESAEVVSRKIVPSSFIELQNIGKCFSYKCYRNSEATIKKEICPKISRVNQYSKLDLESKLECENLFVAVRKNKPYKYDLKNHSGRHKAQTFITDAFTFAKITIQFSNIPKLTPEQVVKFIEDN
ncbi:MAG: hypothetical protein Q8R57_05905 [Bacteroidota bacterium]|nr:hypothetical protein [Bacteroidota bacterium]